ncbi:uncharacterized protein BDZ99DRAFT_525845 [Mytilinidion resinicola]|uniref:Uncharacterized protein n=1 Tax=Mytilinidion resinicola TaxID=574789 RepID=A0A6A6Y6U5_9PEZI|nr:uncharacterized protein BDZ99DRAFT_525845 [Mytilinidion resinicola]KAF2804248.1 hypothetical protein BDZ99DRAFT_525845 [Mytilinidion resinicola]
MPHRKSELMRHLPGWLSQEDKWGFDSGANKLQKNIMAVWAPASKAKQFVPDTCNYKATRLLGPAGAPAGPACVVWWCWKQRMRRAKVEAGLNPQPPDPSKPLLTAPDKRVVLSESQIQALRQELDLASRQFQFSRTQEKTRNSKW